MKDNQKSADDILRDINKEYSDEQILGMCKVSLIDAYDLGDGTPNPYNLEQAYQLKKELELRGVDASVLEMLKKMEEKLQKEYGI